MKLANVTMHDQTQYLAQYRALGYEIDPTPLLRECTGPQDAWQVAFAAIKAAKDQHAHGIILGGRTDVCLYAAITAVSNRLRVFIAETKRVRDENNCFVFNLAGVTPVALTGFMDSYHGMGIQVDTVWAKDPDGVLIEDPDGKNILVLRETAPQ